MILRQLNGVIRAVQDGVSSYCGCILQIAASLILTFSLYHKRALELYPPLRIPPHTDALGLIIGFALLLSLLGLAASLWLKRARAVTILLFLYNLVMGFVMPAITPAVEQ